MSAIEQFDLRYGDRVLGFHAFVNTDRDPNEMAMLIQRASRSDQLEAMCSWLEGYKDGTLQWTDMLRERGVQNDPVLRYSGRLLVFHHFVNTDRDAYHIHKNILRVARGTRLDACVVWSELYEGEGGRDIWRFVQTVAKRTSSDPRAKPYNLGIRHDEWTADVVG